MLTDPKAIEIIAGAKQKNVARAERPDHDFVAILEDFFDGHGFDGQSVLELGPGQFDFARHVRARGGEVHAVDRDPAVLELGTYLGFDVFDVDLKRLDATTFPQRYDGLFCKFAVNAFWFKSLEGLRSAVETFDSLLRPGGWGWIAPWNGVPRRGLADTEVERVLAAQADAFLACGWSSVNLSDALARRYGVSGAVANHALFTRGLEWPESVRQIAGED